MHRQSTVLVVMGLAGILVTACQSGGALPTFDEQVRSFVTPTYSLTVRAESGFVLAP